MRILLTYDFITTQKQTGELALKRLDFITQILSRLDVPITVSQLQNFSREHLLHLCGFTSNGTPYQPITPKMLGKDAKTYIQAHLKGYDLVIGFELAPDTRTIFDHLQIRYIDIWLSPYRFYHDLLLSFSSNDAAINSKFKQYRLDLNTLTLRAQELSQYFTAFWPTPNITLFDDSALIIAQLHVDKAVWHNGAFINLTDCMHELSQLSRSHQHLYLLRHPRMNAEEFNSVARTLETIENLTYIDNMNVYDLLSRKEITTVAAISSSVLAEAECFGKKTVAFYPPVIDVKEQSQIYTHFFGTDFWADVLSLSSNTSLRYFTYDNFLRHRFEAYYAYRPLLEELHHLQPPSQTIEHVSHVCQSIDPTGKYVLYGYGTLGTLIFPHIKNHLVAIIDETLSRNGTHSVDAIPVIPLNALRAYLPATVIITPWHHVTSIIEALTIYDCDVIHFQNHQQKVPT